MNKGTNIFLAIIAILIIISLIIWKEQYYDPTHVTFKTASPTITDIENKILVSGNVYPNKEVEVKSSMSGILEKLYVEVGQEINVGDDIAKVKLVPNPTQIESARKNLNFSLIEFENSEKEYQRNLKLYERKVVAIADFEKIKKQYELAKEQYNSAQNQLKLLLDGFVNTTDISNIVKAPISGTILDLPIEEGASVIERNNFNVGSTLVLIAQMDYFLFKGKVNEADLVKLNTGMTLTLTLNALKNNKIIARIEKIYPKGVEEQGMMKYIIVARFKAYKDSIKIRPGYTATAELVLEGKKNILCIEEKNIKYRNDSAFVELVKGDKIEERVVRTGISNGIKIEISKGIEKSDLIKIID